MLSRNIRLASLAVVAILLTWLISGEYDYWQHQRQCAARCEQLTRSAPSVHEVRYQEDVQLCRCSDVTEQALLLN
ncbi:hypothetical protein MHM93_08630 [Pseudoalteromonas sp. MM17-2]|uniref:hypothetical protein n=1 Tax=Pseudoalteromonas sp. MM17-2 TaxID=2917753 RepID=UPI001EF58B12|nr:hypothetical protein [Pseudoalteromonas sp. MM17-2]MCG7544249.1 hypothetical protein [Pseudoalteromonas sp. MM17-2]